MEIKPDRMISLGYGKFWRSDAIVGVIPIEDERGPGRRTEVYTATLEYPLVASRSERAILQDMAFASEELFRWQEAREMLSDLADALDDVPDVVKRMLNAEARFDAAAWVRRLRAGLQEAPADDEEDQSDFFSE